MALNRVRNTQKFISSGKTLKTIKNNHFGGSKTGRFGTPIGPKNKVEINSFAPGNFLKSFLECSKNLFFAHFFSEPKVFPSKGIYFRLYFGWGMRLKTLGDEVKTIPIPQLFLAFPSKGIYFELIF